MDQGPRLTLLRMNQSEVGRAKVAQGNLKGQLKIVQVVDFTGAGTGIRTRDLLITNQLLYQLSYSSNERETGRL